MIDYLAYFQNLGTTIAINLGIVLACSVVFAIVATVLGCLFAGIDRKISAKMQGRIGPPILQPYYDVRKLFDKDRVSVNGSERIYITFALIFVFISGGIFFSGIVYYFMGSFTTGGNWILCVFILTLATLLFIMAAYSSRSPYAEVGAAREILQVVSYEPTVMLMTVGLCIVTGTFSVQAVFTSQIPLIVYLWPTFICLVFILIIKFRKSPFDISMSHHAHQEIVRGMTTEMCGPTLGKVEIMHWNENFLFLAWVALFFIFNNPASIALAIVVAIVIYLLMIWIDNNFARVKWQAMLKWSWLLCLILCGVNLVVLLFV